MRRDTVAPSPEERCGTAGLGPTQGTACKGKMAMGDHAQDGGGSNSPPTHTLREPMEAAIISDVVT